MYSFTQTISEPYILDLGYCEEGEEIKISLDCTTMDSSETYAEIYAYTVDEEVLTNGYNRLKSSAINVTSHSDTKITGTITVDENSVLYSSIPYDSGWTILIDGEEAETFEIGDAMLGTTIKPGEHTVEYVYSPKGIKLGAVISVASAVGICCFIILKKRKSKEELTTINII
jgi:uncharacterized membrane protein YfhO